jgi:hypothetical protein
MISCRLLQMIGSFYTQADKTPGGLVLRALKPFARDIQNPGMISQMHNGTMLAILYKVIEASLNGFSRARMQMENDLKLRAATYSHSEMEGFLSKIPIGKIDH